jgi:hypothetical protein
MPVYPRAGKDQARPRYDGLNASAKAFVARRALVYEMPAAAFPVAVATSLL